MGGAGAWLTAGPLFQSCGRAGSPVGVLDVHILIPHEQAHSPLSCALLLLQQRGSRPREVSVEGPGSRLGSGPSTGQPVSSPPRLDY